MFYIIYFVFFFLIYLNFEIYIVINDMELYVWFYCINEFFIKFFINLILNFEYSVVGYSIFNGFKLVVYLRKNYKYNVVFVFRNYKIVVF